MSIIASRMCQAGHSVRGEAGRLDSHAQLLAGALDRAGLPFSVEDTVEETGRAPARLRIAIAGQTYIYRSAVLSRLDKATSKLRHVNGEAIGITRSKASTKAVLAAAGVSVPAGRTFDRMHIHAAIEYATRMGAVCVKPENGTNARHVFPRCNTLGDVRDALLEVFDSSAVAIVEESLPGEVFRCAFVEPTFMGSRYSRVASVTGDGRATVRELIEELNAERRRRNLLGYKPIAVHAAMVQFIRAQGFELDAVLKAGTNIRLSPVANFARDGGEGINFAPIDPSYEHLAERAFRSIPGLRIGAIDMIVAEPRVPASGSNAWILEVNSSPSIDTLEYPWDGRPMPMSDAIVAMLLRDAERFGDADIAPLDAQATLLQEAVHRAGIETRIVSIPGHVGKPQTHLRFTIGRTSYNHRYGALRRVEPGGPPRGRHINGEAVEHAENKARTKLSLAAHGVCVPAGRAFQRGRESDAVAFALELAGPVCVKPNGGRKGFCVFPERVGERAVAEAFRAVAERYEEILVEESVRGDEIRFFYVEPDVVAVKMSVPAALLGNGSSTVFDLIRQKNDADTGVRLANQKPVLLDHRLVRTLAEQGLDFGDVAEAGRSIRLAHTANGATGGSHIECRDTIHPSYWEMAARAFHAIPGLVIGTIDVLVRDRSAPAETGSYWVLEVNHSPGLLPYHYPWEGRPQDVGGAIVKFLLAREAATAS